jgi:hypothetical protein
MALSGIPVLPQKPQLYTAELLSTTGGFTFAANSTTVTNLVSIATIGTNGALIESIQVSNSDTAAYSLQLLFLPTGGKLLLLGTVNIPLSSGMTTAAPPVQLLNSTNMPGLPKDTNNNSYLLVPASGLLYVGTTATLTASTQVSVIAVGADF